MILGTINKRIARGRVRGASTTNKNPNHENKDWDLIGAPVVDKSVDHKKHERENIEHDYIELLSDDWLMDTAVGKPNNETIAEKLPV